MMMTKAQEDYEQLVVCTDHAHTHATHMLRRTRMQLRQVLALPKMLNTFLSDILNKALPPLHSPKIMALACSSRKVCTHLHQPQLQA